jgi:GNAT superfamily N-acetyltransferase
MVDMADREGDELQEAAHAPGNRATNSQLVITRAGPHDAATLTEIAFAAKRHWGYPERWIAAWTGALTMTPEAIGAAEVHAAVLEGEVVGFYALAGEGPTLELEHLWVLPRAMGAGVGRALFEHATARALALGASAVEIESDPNAVGFYERMGARRVGEGVSRVEGEERVLPLLAFVVARE